MQFSTKKTDGLSHRSLPADNGEGNKKDNFIIHNVFSRGVGKGFGIWNQAAFFFVRFLSSIDGAFPTFGLQVTLLPPCLSHPSAPPFSFLSFFLYRRHGFV